MSGHFTIAIDGPAASGKGTLARRLAQHLGLPHLDTGLTYRAVANALINKNLPLDDEAIACQIARELDLGTLNQSVLRAHDIGEAASKIAVMSTVRSALVEAQRNFAAKGSGAVLDGRDIGTVVLPRANVKLFVSASAKTRAERRHKEILAAGGNASLGQILADIEKRDTRDMGREDSPLKPAQDAHLIDTTKMDIETAFSTALEIVENVKAGKSI